MLFSVCFWKRYLGVKPMIEKILIRGAKVHNLKNIDVDIPLGKIVGIAGVSGSGRKKILQQHHNNKKGGWTSHIYSLQLQI